MNLLPRRLIFIGLIVLGFAAMIATSSGQATAPPEAPRRPELASSLAADPAKTVSGEHLSNLPPPPEQDPCLSCHISGAETGEWTPISRWFIFGAMGLIFIFGISRNLIVWQTRDLWHHRLMVHLGRITAFFFVIQAISGIILVFCHQSTLEAIISIVSVIQAIHWGSGIILFIATLGLSFAGYLLPWYQRAFWAIIAITAIFGSSLAIANLSFAYLYADWHIPLSPSHLYAFHVLLLPVVIASMISIYIIILRKRGEIK